MLILLFGVKPSTAISSDLVAAVLMRPVGAVVHMTKKTVNYSLVGWMVLGSVPAALLGAYVLHLLGNSTGAENNVQTLLGVALLLGAFAMVLRYGLDRRSGQSRSGLIGQVVVRPVPTVAIGILGGFVVGVTSVGSGSLMIVLLLFLYPVLGANQLVGTDLTQAVPLTLAAALGALAFGHVEFSVTTSIVLGSVPAVLIGSLISSRAPDRYIRPVITFVIFASGLKYVGLSTTALGWTLGAVLVATATVWLAYVRPRRAGLGRGPGRRERARSRGRHRRTDCSRRPPAAASDLVAQRLDLGDDLLRHDLAPARGDVGPVGRPDVDDLACAVGDEGGVAALGRPEGVVGAEVDDGRLGLDSLLLHDGIDVGHLCVQARRSASAACRPRRRWPRRSRRSA